MIDSSFSQLLLNPPGYTHNQEASRNRGEMFIAMSANRRLIIHEGRLQMFAIEQHDINDFRIIQEVHRTQLGEPYATRKTAQEALKQLGEIAIRATPPQQESPEIAGFLNR